MFLHTIAHHEKNRVIKFHFMRSGQMVSKNFHNVLHSIIRLHGVLFVRPEPVADSSTDERWKWFKVRTYFCVMFKMDSTHGVISNYIFYIL